MENMFNQLSHIFTDILKRDFSYEENTTRKLFFYMRDASLGMFFVKVFGFKEIFFEGCLKEFKERLNEALWESKKHKLDSRICRHEFLVTFLDKSCIRKICVIKKDKKR